MKKLIFGLVLAVLLAMPLSARAAEDQFKVNLRFGQQRNAQVSKLQEFLADKGFYTGPVTGNFFSLTLKAVKAFQSANNISPVSGYFGPLTRTKANDLIESDLAEANAEADADTTAPVVIEPKTTDDVIAKIESQTTLLNEQLIKQQLQNEILQRQLERQQATSDALDKIVKNTTPPPAPVIAAPAPAPVLDPGVTVNRPVAGWGVLDFTTKDDSFVIEALIVSTDSKVIGQSVADYEGHYIKLLDGKTAKNFRITSCIDLEYSYMNIVNKHFPFICPGKDAASQEAFYQGLIMGYGTTAIDFYDRKSNFYFVLDKNQTYQLGISKSVKFDYIRLVGQESGKVVEFSNL